MKHYHSAVSLDYLERQYGIGDKTLENESGVPLPKKNAILEIWAKRRIGLRYWPPCEHITPDGRCAGHEKGEA